MFRAWFVLLYMSQWFSLLLYRDAYIVSLGDAITSVFAGLVIFAILGFMANELDTTVDKVADEGIFSRSR